MCIFTGTVQDIASTRIFARLEKERQILVYAMAYASKQQVAMILPIPVKKGAGEGAVVFINLQAYPGFFVDLGRAFADTSVSLSIGGDASAGQLLEVHAVGDFEASYVPGMGEFHRLDPRFRLPEHLWQHLPRYRDWGFAVFKLSPTAQAKAKRDEAWNAQFNHEIGVEPGMEVLMMPTEVHPMAFSFPTRHLDQLYFPTVHIHDGQWHPLAEFNHNLYCQLGSPPKHWQPSMGPLGDFMVSRLAAGVLDPRQPGFHRTIAGRAVNQDIWVRLNEPLKAAS